MNNPSPIHSADEVAAFLRKEIAHRDEWIAGIKTRRQRISDRYEAQHDAAFDNGEKAHIARLWGEELRAKDAELKLAEAERFAFRRTLQYLTGELWS